MKRSLRFAPLALVTLLGASAHAQDLPNIEKALTAPKAQAQPSRSSSGAVASWDAQRAVPTFLWADPTANKVAPPIAASASPEGLAWAYLDKNAALYRLSRPARDAAFVRHVHDTGRGGIIVILGQRTDGIEVFETEMKFLLDRAGNLVAIGGNLSTVATPLRKGTAKAFAKGPASAIAIAANDAFEMSISAADLLDLKQEKAGYRSFDLSPASKTKATAGLNFVTPARAKKVFYSMPDRLVPAYYLEVDAGSPKDPTSRLYGYVIAAETGEILMRRDLVHNETFTYRVWADQAAPNTPLSGPQADYSPHPTGTPDGSVPAFVPPVLIPMEAFNTNPMNGVDPWLPANAMVSTGNNVDAYADISGQDGFDSNDVRATPTGPLEFDRVYDTSQSPAASQSQIMASVTQLFYVNNWLHDYYYDSGFNESAGNAQEDNFGRGGAEGDSIRAEAQDSGGTNNANMSTPADGQHPRMQMYVWSSGGAATSSLIIQPGNLMYNHQVAGFGPTSYNVTANLILANDGTGGDPNDACSAITNNVTGQIALVNRGGCTFESKVLRAQQAGAVGVLIANNQGGLPPMGDDPATNGVTIGSLGISQANGNTLKTMLMNGTVTVTMSAQIDPQRDGSIDNDIVAHEWGHYFHNRLVACGTQQCGGQGEGWGDVTALIMDVRDGDNVATGTFAAAIYSTVSLGDSGYFGIRRFPYSRDMTKNGLTFKHITNGVALPSGPQNPIGVPNFEVHNAGEVWASMVFEAYTNLILNGGHPFAETKRRMADYIVAGMMMAPPNPTFTEQRDGILAAAQANDPADFALLADGFAKRGAGTCAVSPPKNSTTGQGVVEDFSVSGQHEFVKATLDDSIKSCDGDGILDATEIGKLHITVRNAGGIPLAGTSASVSANNPAITFPNGNTANLPTIAPYETAETTVDVALDQGVMDITAVDFAVSLNNPAACNAMIAGNETIFLHLDDTPDSSTVETFDSAQAPWTTWGNLGYETLADQVWSRDLAGNGNYRYYGQNFPAHSDTALVTPDLVVGNGAFIVTFNHAYDFESSPENPGDPDTRWDGGLIEITDDGGATWQDVDNFANPQYSGVIANVMGADNPLGDRPGYVGQSAAWPNTNTVSLDFGNAFAGKTVQLRFRIGTDAAAGVPDFLGWFIDDISVSGTNNKPFHTVTVDAVGCNLAPIADAGSDQIVNEGDTTSLDATGSSDPEGDTLTYSWAQIAGPNAPLSDPASASPSLTAPMVDADTALTYELSVSDGNQTATDTISILVKDTSSGTGGNGTGGSGTGGNATGGNATGGNAGGNGGEGGEGGNGFNLDDSGCGCRTDGQSTPFGGTGALSALGLAAVLVRRRRNRKS